ncbi:MAG: hypothetical protein KME23_20495 [Goleter apudmare HA4340-LM2]|nr:hypothetical protein [Goleter apudmare HA4340-LM2]
MEISLDLLLNPVPTSFNLKRKSERRWLIRSDILKGLMMICVDLKKSGEWVKTAKFARLALVKRNLV